MKEFNAIFGTEAAKAMQKAVDETNKSTKELKKLMAEKSKSIGISITHFDRTPEETLARYKRIRGICQ